MAYTSRVTTQRNTLIETPFSINNIGLGDLFTGPQTETMFKQNIDFSDIEALYIGGVGSNAAGQAYNIVLKFDTTTKATITINAAGLYFIEQIDCSAVTGAHDLIIEINAANALNANSYVQLNMWGAIA